MTTNSVHGKYNKNPLKDLILNHVTRSLKYASYMYVVFINYNVIYIYMLFVLMWNSYDLLHQNWKCSELEREIPESWPTSCSVQVHTSFQHPAKLCLWLSAVIKPTVGLIEHGVVCHQCMERACCPPCTFQEYVSICPLQWDNFSTTTNITVQWENLSL